MSLQKISVASATFASNVNQAVSKGGLPLALRCSPVGLSIFLIVMLAGAIAKLAGWWSIRHLRSGLISLSARYARSRRELNAVVYSPLMTRVFCNAARSFRRGGIMGVTTHLRFGPPSHCHAASVDFVYDSPERRNDSPMRVLPYGSRHHWQVPRYPLHFQWHPVNHPNRLAR